MVKAADNEKRGGAGSAKALVEPRSTSLNLKFNSILVLRAKPNGMGDLESRIYAKKMLGSFNGKQMF